MFQLFYLFFLRPLIVMFQFLYLFFFCSKIVILCFSFYTCFFQDHYSLCFSYFTCFFSSRLLFVMFFKTLWKKKCFHYISAGTREGARQPDQRYALSLFYFDILVATLSLCFSWNRERITGTQIILYLLCFSFFYLFFSWPLLLLFFSAGTKEGARQPDQRYAGQPRQHLLHHSLQGGG